MRHLHFSEEPKTSYEICFLVPVIDRDEIQKHYLEMTGLDPDQILVLDLHQRPGKGKTPKAEMKEYLEQEIQPVLEELNVQYVFVADAEYFKVLTETSQADRLLGYVLDSKMGPQKVLYIPNFRTVFYDPTKVKQKIAQSLAAMLSDQTSAYKPPGIDVIKHEQYPSDLVGIAAALQMLLDKGEALSVDIETFGLKFNKAGIGTITFCWNQHEGLAFLVDYEPLPVPQGAVYGKKIVNHEVRELLKWFFIELHNRKIKTIYHHISFDVMVLIYQLFMDDITDTKGLLRGLEVMLPEDNWDCTRLISYLALNSCAGNQLSLKDLAQEFAGSYAQSEIKDITRIPPKQLLRYNLVDGLSTWFVHNTYYPKMVADQQEEIYKTLFQPGTRDIIQMQLTGLPVDMQRVRQVHWDLYRIRREAMKKVHQSPVAKMYLEKRRHAWVELRNTELKKKRVSYTDALQTNDPRAKFNPGSGDQLQEILYEVLQLPVLAYTKSKQPSTKADVIKDLKNHTDDNLIHEFLDALIELSTVSIVLETFIPALRNAIKGKDGWHYLCGNFTLGGPLSGRLSSSDPNLQNLPAGAEGTKTLKGRIGKLIKSCIVAPPGWIFVGLDFASLEDRISALTTKDPNKLKVYIDGYDGHSLRAYAYYKDLMPDIDGSTVAGINSIQEKYKPLRDKSKNPTFTLTYQGTHKTLVTKYKFPQDLALKVEAAYHELYKVSDQWVKDQLDQAAKDGYVTVAFGLRVRTPLLAQVIRGTSKTPHEAEAEGRSAGNALGQSWCLLNTRAWVAFLEKVRKSRFKYDIRPCAQIHDAGYALVRDSLSAVTFTNINLVKEVQWQDHPLIQHPQVKLGGELSIYWPSWAEEIVIPNGAKDDEIIEIVQAKLQPKP